MYEFRTSPPSVSGSSAYDPTPKLFFSYLPDDSLVEYYSLGIKRLSDINTPVFSQQESPYTFSTLQPSGSDQYRIYLKFKKVDNDTIFGDDLSLYLDYFFQTPPINFITNGNIFVSSGIVPSVSGTRNMGCGWSLFKESVSGHYLICSTPSGTTGALKSELIPVEEGSSYEFSYDQRSVALTSGYATIEEYDINQDLIPGNSTTYSLTSTTSDWDTFTNDITTSEKCKYLKFLFGILEGSGTFHLRNINLVPT
jgi:hypothetical protein